MTITQKSYVLDSGRCFIASVVFSSRLELVQAHQTQKHCVNVSVRVFLNGLQADTESHSIRMLDIRKGTLELNADTGAKGDGSEHDPLHCKMTRTQGVFVGRDGAH